MGFFSKLKGFASKAVGKIKGFVTKIPGMFQKAKSLIPRIKQGFAKVSAMIDLLPDAAKGPLKSALSQAESLTDKADGVIDKGMMMSNIVTGGNADAAAGGEE